MQPLEDEEAEPLRAVLEPVVADAMSRPTGREAESDELPGVRLALHLHLRAEEDELEWEVRSFVLDERLHAPYALSLLVPAQRDEVDLEGLLGGRVVFEIARGMHARVVHGVVLEAELVEGIEGLDGPGVELHVAPAFAFLGLTRHSRVFQGLSVVAIVLATLGPVLAEHGGAVCVDQLGRRYEPRDYCVQYRETDLDFMLRILASEGITLMLDHSSGVETVVLVDDNEALPNAGHEPLDDVDEPPPRMPIETERAESLPIESISAVGQQRRVRQRHWSVSAWDWMARPGALRRSTSSTDLPATDGGWWETDEGRSNEGEGPPGAIIDRTQRWAHLRRLGELATVRMLRASSNATILRAGSVFELLDTPDAEHGEKWVVTAVQHRGEVVVDGSQGLGDANDSAGRTAAVHYVNDIECQPLRQPVVPPRVDRPRALGLHSAIVTGPPGEEVHTDRFGRIRVRMLWDEQEHEGEPTSCWLRVATPWAGDGFGAVLIPRVGTEVLVSFIDGDPDRPICNACVHAGPTMPPYDLPTHATRTVLRTRSVGGKGFNELSFEDAAGDEEVFLHAQRNLREKVLAHHATEVGANDTAAVGGSRYARIGKDDVTVTAGEHRHTVSGRATVRYLGGYALHVGEVSADAGARGIPEDGEPETPAGGFELRSIEPIVLRCGDSRLELRPDSIVLHASRIAVEGERVVTDGRRSAELRTPDDVDVGQDETETH